MTIKIPAHFIDKIESLAKEWGLDSNEDVVHKLLIELLNTE